MIVFNDNKHINLPYNKEHYFDFLDDDLDDSHFWSAVSFQTTNNNESTVSLKHVSVLETLFKQIILQLDSGSPWIVNHFYKDFDWFPNNDENLNSLRTLFKENKIQNTYRGALSFMADDLIKFANNLILYPYILSYRDLDISHTELPFIIKITNHLTIDLFCTDKLVLRKVINDNSLINLTVKEYRGSAL